MARRYARFPLVASWARLLDMAGSGTILFLMFSACYSSEIAGFMFLTERVVARPLFIVSTSLMQVFIGEAGKSVQHDPTRFRRRLRQVVPRQFLLAAAWIAAANLRPAGRSRSLFGEQWDPAIPYSARTERRLPGGGRAASGIHVAADHGATGTGRRLAGGTSRSRRRRRDRAVAARPGGAAGCCGSRPWRRSFPAPPCSR